MHYFSFILHFKGATVKMSRPDCILSPSIYSEICYPLAFPILYFSMFSTAQEEGLKRTKEAESFNEKSKRYTLDSVCAIDFMFPKSLNKMPAFFKGTLGKTW